MNEKAYQKVIEILVDKIKELELTIYVKDLEIRDLKKEKEGEKNA